MAGPINANTDLSSASSAANQSANNQNFSNMFGAKNAAAKNYTAPVAFIVIGIIALVFIIKRGR